MITSKQMAHLRPINRTAALVTGNGVSFQIDDNRNNTVCARTPLPLREITKEMLESPGFTDLTGFKKGRLTVMGLYLHRGVRGAAWSVRCACGVYETRVSRSLKSDFPYDACFECKEIVYLKRKDYYNRTGKDLPEDRAWGI